MAKKKAVAEKKKAWDEKPAGKPARQCEACEKWYHPRQAICPNCGKPNAARDGSTAVMAGSKKKVAKKSAKASGRQMQFPPADISLESTVNFVRAAGGIEGAKQAIARIEELKNL